MKHESRGLLNYFFLFSGSVLLFGLLLLLFSNRKNFPSAFPLLLHATTMVFLPMILLSGIEFGLPGAYLTATIASIVTLFCGLRAGQPSVFVDGIVFFTGVILLHISIARNNTRTVQEELHTDWNQEQVNEAEKRIVKSRGIRTSLRKKISRFDGLCTIAESLGISLSYNTVLDQTIAAVTNTLKKGDLCRLFLLDEEMDKFVLSKEKNMNRSAKRIGLSPEDRFNRWLFRNRAPLIIKDLSADFRFEEDDVSRALGSLIAAPLVTDNKIIGAIRISSTRPNAFKVDDLRLLTAIGNIASVSIRNAKLYSDTEALSIRDGLTGLFVKRYFNDKLRRAFLKAKKAGLELIVIMVDIDNFKLINDTYGHNFGDYVLKHISELFKEKIGKEGTPSRYGGEEYTAFFIDHNKDEVIKRSEKFLYSVRSQTISVRRNIINITASIGISALKSNDFSFENLIHRADKALYEVKRSGKNRILFS
ncbi:MAG: sensor domain-containing diguanylate cyclase [Candidatus Theseobacter exili]|nr:sensor domain-containing diguanylate cyclase [Candidatus Theseobacter exili]